MPAFNHPKLKYAINRLLELDEELELLDELEEELHEELELEDEQLLLLDEAFRVFSVSLDTISLTKVLI